MRQQYEAHPCERGMGLFDGTQSTTHFSTEYITMCHARQVAELPSTHGHEISFKNEGTRLHMNVPVQQRYLDARRRYETIQEQCIAPARPFDPRDIEGFSKRLVTAERQLGYLQAYQEMKQAEQALVAWAQSLAQLEANQDLARLFQSYRYYPDSEARMIELCLSINVDDTRSS